MQTDKIQGSIRRSEFQSRHYYFVDGEYFAGVTSILDEAGPVGYGLRHFFMNHTANEAESIRDEAAEFGSRLHDLYEKLLNGAEIPLTDEDPRAIKHLMSFSRWYKEFAPSEVETEQMVFHKDYKFAGTLDLVCMKDGERWIIDFKSGSSLHFSHEVQIAAYRECYKKMTGKKVDHVALLRTGSKHKVGYEFVEIERPFDDFLNIYKTFLALNGGELPKLPELLTQVYPDTIRL